MEYSDIYRNLDCFNSFQSSLIRIVKTYYFGLVCKLTGQGNLLPIWFNFVKILINHGKVAIVYYGGHLQLAQVVDGYQTQTEERKTLTDLYLNEKGLEERVWHPNQLRILTNFDLNIATLLKRKITEGVFLEVESNVEVLKYTLIDEVMGELYPEDIREKITKLDLTQKGLRGSLDLRGFGNLEELTINMDYLENLEHLTELDISYNPHIKLGLESLKNLEKLELIVHPEVISEDNGKIIQKINECLNESHGYLKFLNEKGYTDRDLENKIKLLETKSREMIISDSSWLEGKMRRGKFYFLAQIAEILELQRNIEEISKVKFEEYENRIKELEERKKKQEEEEKKLLTEINQWEINFQHLQQVKDNEIENKNARIDEQNKKIKKAVDLLEKQKADIEKKQKDIQKLEEKIKNIHPQDAHVMSFLAHLQEDLKSELANKKEIEKQVKDLEKQQAEDKLARDKEIEELKERVKVLEKTELNEKEVRLIELLFEISERKTPIAYERDEFIKNEKVKELIKILSSTSTTKKIGRYIIREICNNFYMLNCYYLQKITVLTKTIKELTEVKMKREKSEERLKKQSEEFLQVQQMNQVVYEILGEYSQKTGLLLRSQEVIRKLKEEKEKNDIPPMG
ncbi:15623_t:CDS:2 [Funneliformis geosporum]|nr:15623_t:CDS:2 [Funneliformis geosporum]